MSTTYTLSISSQNDGMNSSANITTDNVEDIERLLKLAGMKEEPGYVSSADAHPANAPEVHQPVTVAHVEPVSQADSMSQMRSLPGFADVCPHCGKTDCECDDDCSCKAEADMYETAEHDYGMQEVDDEGEPVDVEEYIWQGPKEPQRIAHVGNNPLAENLFAQLQKEWKNFLNEADLSGDAGVMSPLTDPTKPEFDKDPMKNEKPVTDGSMSPFSTVRRQKVTKSD